MTRDVGGPRQNGVMSSTVDALSPEALRRRVDRLDRLAETLDEAVRDLIDGAGLTMLDDAEIVQVLTIAGRLQRRVEGVFVEAVGQVGDRSASGDADLRMTTRYGCRSTGELAQRATLAGPHTVARWARAAKAVHRETSMATGELLPAVLPAMRAAMIDGWVGVDGLVAAAQPLADLARRADSSALLAADRALADAARGAGPDGSPAACADLLRVQATAWATALDPDGSEPRDRVATWKRGLTLGPASEGLVPLHGRLLVEVAAQLKRIIDAVGSPRVEGDTGGVRFRPGDSGPAGDEPYTDANGPLDDRRVAQRQHDALATALFAAAASGSLPTIGGAAPTVVVSVREGDLARSAGWGHVDGCDEPLSMRAVETLACAGVIQRVVLADDGRVVRIGTDERVFNKHQRRAIALRDGGCLIPGCGVPAAWCEIHHVTEHSRGGPTHVDNGVLLCWFHHRYLDGSGWRVRMMRGVPEVRAPSWNDASGTWRRVTKSPGRLKDLVVRRT